MLKQLLGDKKGSQARREPTAPRLLQAADDRTIGAHAEFQKVGHTFSLCADFPRKSLLKSPEFLNWKEKILLGICREARRNNTNDCETGRVRHRGVSRAPPAAITLGVCGGQIFARQLQSPRGGAPASSRLLLIERTS
jgi:hypothetical protein